MRCLVRGLAVGVATLLGALPGLPPRAASPAAQRGDPGAPQPWGEAPLALCSVSPRLHYGVLTTRADTELPAVCSTLLLGDVWKLACDECVDAERRLGEELGDCLLSGGVCVILREADWPEARGR